MSWAHRYVDVSLSSLIVVAQPVVSTLAAAVFLDETLNALQVGGVVVALLGIAAVIRSHRALEADLATRQWPWLTNCSPRSAPSSAPTTRSPATHRRRLHPRRGARRRCGDARRGRASG